MALLKKVVLVLLAARFTQCLHLPKIYSDGMVLQGLPVESRIWGFLDGDFNQLKLNYSCNYSGMDEITYTPEKDEDTFLFKIKLIQNDACNFTISQSDSKVVIVLENVLIGDVWVCSGQSNMDFSLGGGNGWDGNGVLNSAEELEKMTEYQNIRMFKLDRMYSPEIEYDLIKDQSIGWTSTKDIEATKHFSAVCLLTARYMADVLGKDKTFGLIQSSWGGTRIEPWSTPEGLEACEIENNVDEEYPQQSNSYLYNAMIHPLVRTSIYGVLWYQGESNTGWNRDKYGCSFAQMISEWRKVWSTKSGTDSKFPFGFIQLSTNQADTKRVYPAFPMIRWHQTSDFGYVPNKDLQNVFMGVSIDTYDSEYGIHPRNKQTPSKRLALAGLNVAYGRTEFPTNGPFPVSIDITRLEEDLQIDIAYDKSFLWNSTESEGFYVCYESEVTECNNMNGKWKLVPNGSVTPNSQSLSMIVEGSATALAYLWATTPVLRMEALPMYADDEFRLPGAPWWISFNESNKIHVSFN